MPSADQLLALPRRRFDEAAGRIARALEVAVERKATRLARARLVPATLENRLAQARQRLRREGDQLPKCAAALRRGKLRDFTAVSARLRVEPVAARLRQTSVHLGALERRAANGLAARLQRPKLTLEALARRRETAIDGRLRRLRAPLEQAARLVASLSYTSVLERGFAVVLDERGGLVKRAAALGDGEQVTMRFADGERGAVTNGDAPPRPRPPAARPKAAPGGQASLFD
jgi:exodeoxyribonuclease VII large subunit